jgi:hypothetical protein
MAELDFPLPRLNGIHDAGAVHLVMTFVAICVSVSGGACAWEATPGSATVEPEFMQAIRAIGSSPVSNG